MKIYQKIDKNAWIMKKLDKISRNNVPKHVKIIKNRKNHWKLCKNLTKMGIKSNKLIKNYEKLVKWIEN